MTIEKKLTYLRGIIFIINDILMTITIALEFIAFKLFVHFILCSFILLLTTVMLVIDGILKSRKNMVIDAIIYALWFGTLMKFFFFFI